MLNSLRLGMALLLFAISAFVQNNKPHVQSSVQKKPCDWARTQQELNECSGEQYRKADARLNALYSKLMGLLEKDLAEAQRKNDADQKNHDETAIQKLKAAERAWIQYRDLHCDAARHQFAGGSMGPMVWADCMAETTEHRVVELKDAYSFGDRQLE